MIFTAPQVEQLSFKPGDWCLWQHFIDQTPMLCQVLECRPCRYYPEDRSGDEVLVKFKDPTYVDNWVTARALKLCKLRLVALAEGPEGGE